VNRSCRSAGTGARSKVRVDETGELGQTARSMALRVVFAWIGLNVGALLLLGLVDVLRMASKRVAKLIAKPQPLQQHP
jgi:hypothetical protein